MPSSSSSSPGRSLRICTVSKAKAAAKRSSSAGGRQLPPVWRPKNRPSMPTSTGLGRCGVLAREHELRDLDRVQRRALAEVVAGEKQREPTVDRRVAADPPHEHLVAARGLPGRRELVELN